MDVVNGVEAVGSQQLKSVAFTASARQSIRGQACLTNTTTGTLYLLVRRFNTHGNPLIGRNRRHCRWSSWPSYPPPQSYGRSRSMGQRWLQIQNGQEGGSGNPRSQVCISLRVAIISSPAIQTFAQGWPYTQAEAEGRAPP